MKERIAKKERKTKETDIIVELNIDGAGEYEIDTGIGFLDHMLELFAFWGHFDLKIKVNKGDFKIDIHHTNEDTGILLGQTFKEALGDKEGIKRLGSASVPMEDVTASVSVDISGRGSSRFNIAPTTVADKDGYELNCAEHFLDAFAKQLGMNLNISVENPNDDLHATIEPVFKALGKALDEATQIDPRRKGIPSTKGVID
ncbi:MAG: imidazoleglycerol-phosphate dehydratase [Candidatus Omnitrophica bacterium]|nr:imidazoleglycerol-phosphate dehydratase [Candidatus Omnitrophota bacterium]MDD5591822.1 imidazoleglycerol-phosphate dehydratase [Candidatus Omnitrophota bacterium]